MRDLDTLRGEIDRVNKQMLALLTERLSLCAEVAEYKRAHHLPVYVPEREEAILNWAASAAGEAFAPYAREYFQALMDLSKEYERETGALGGAGAD